ncbi:MAG: hypothetical protein RLZZ175_1607 [Bacteroidota bacterium]|jgi:O-antigen ligase
MIVKLLKNNESSIFYMLCLFFFISLIFSIKLNNLAIGLILLYFLFRENMYKNFKFKIINPFFIIYLFYGLCVLFSLVYSSNLEQGVKLLERNASLALLPFILVTNYDLITKSALQKIMNIFSCVIFAVMLASIVYCLYKSDYIFSISTFYRDNLIQLTHIHSPYLALFISFVGLWLVNIITDHLISRNYRELYLYIPFYLLSIFFNLLLATRITLLGLLFISFLLLIIKLKKIKLSIIFLIGATMLVLISFKMMPTLFTRYTEIIETSLNPPLGDNHNSVNMRVAHWQCAVELISEDYFTFFFGTGIGDTQDLMNLCYKSHGWSWVLYEYNYNCHSQILQTFLGQGVIGFLLYMLLFLYPIYYSIKHKMYFVLSFYLLFFICSATESTFNNQKGVVFFAFFSAIFMSYIVNYIKSKKVE